MTSSRWQTGVGNQSGKSAVCLLPNCPGGSQACRGLFEGYAVNEQFDIKTVRDFLAVPADRRELCVLEFLSWLRLCDAIDRSDLFQPMDTFKWVDDDKGIAEIRAMHGSKIIASKKGRIE